MLLTVHDENRTVTANNEKWQSFNSTPDENEDSFNHYSKEESECSVRPFGQS